MPRLTNRLPWHLCEITRGPPPLYQDLDDTGDLCDKLLVFFFHIAMHDFNGCYTKVHQHWSNCNFSLQIFFRYSMCHKHPKQRFHENFYLGGQTSKLKANLDWAFPSKLLSKVICIWRGVPLNYSFTNYTLCFCCQIFCGRKGEKEDLISSANL